MQFKNGQVAANSDRSNRIRPEKQQRGHRRRPKQQPQQTTCNKNISNNSSSSRHLRTATHHNGLLPTSAAAAAATTTMTMLPTTAAESSPLSSSSSLSAQSSASATTAATGRLLHPTITTQSTLANSLLDNLFVPQQQTDRDPFEPAQQRATTFCTQQQQLCQPASPSASQYPGNCSAVDVERMLEKYLGNCSAADVERMLDKYSPYINFSSMGVRVWIKKSSLEIWFRVSLSAPIVLLGVLGNLTIIYSMCKFKPFRTKPTNIFILSMAIADLLTSLVCPGAALFNYIYQFYVLGAFVCRLEGFVKITCLLVSSYSLIVLSSDWLLSIVRPFRARITIRQSWLVLSVIWITSILLATPLFGWRSLRERQWKDLREVFCREEINYTRYYWPFVCLVLVYLPTVFMTIVLLVILAQMDKFESKLRRSAHKNNKNPQQNQVNSSSLAINMKYRRRIVKILFIYLLTSIVSWTPFQFTVIHRYRRHGTIDDLPSWYNNVNFFAQLGASLAAAMNPIIFGFKSQPYRQIVSKLLKFKFLDKIMTTNNGKNSGNELRPMDQARNNNRQQPATAGAANNQQPNKPIHNHHQTNQQQQTQTAYKAQAAQKNSSKLQISTTNLSPAAATANQAGSKQSAVGQSAKGTSRPPFSAVGAGENGDASNTNTSNNCGSKRVSFDTSIHSSLTVRQPNAASSVSTVKTFVRAIKQANTKSTGHANNLENGQANAAFELDDDQELALVGSNFEQRSVNVRQHLEVPSAIRKSSQNAQLGDCSIQRDLGPSPLSIVSMDSINIEENLEHLEPSEGDDDDDDDATRGGY